MVAEGSSDASIGFFFRYRRVCRNPFSLAHGKLELHELLPSIQSESAQCQALDADFSYQRGGFPERLRRSLREQGILMRGFLVGMEVTGMKALVRKSSSPWTVTKAPLRD